MDVLELLVFSPVGGSSNTMGRKIVVLVDIIGLSSKKNVSSRWQEKFIESIDTLVLVHVSVNLHQVSNLSKSYASPIQEFTFRSSMYALCAARGVIFVFVCSDEYQLTISTQRNR